MQETQLLLQNFQFTPSEISVECPHRIVVRIGRNRNESRIYSAEDRFFVIGVAAFESSAHFEEVESDPLYESSTFEYEFTCSGVYTVSCVNYTKARCRVLVQQIAKPIVTCEIVEIPKQPAKPPRPRVPSPHDRPFKISPTEMTTLVQSCEIEHSQHSDEEASYLDTLYQEHRKPPVIYNPRQNRYEARSEQRFRMVEEQEDEDDNEDYMSCYHDFSMEASKKRSKTHRTQFRKSALSNSNADSLSTYNTWYPIHQQHSNKIETQSTFSELCDQLPFTSHNEDAKEQQQKVGRKNSDPLIQNVKEDNSNSLKKYRFQQKPYDLESRVQTEQTQIIEQDSSDKTGHKSSESDKEFTTVPQRYFKQLVKSITSRQLTYIVPPVLCNELTMFHEYHANLREYLEEDFTIALDFFE